MKTEDDIAPLWRLHDEYTVEQAAALIAGYDPGRLAQSPNDADFPNTDPRMYAAKTALVNAINGGWLTATIRYSAREYGYADALADFEANDANHETGFGRTAEDREILAEDNSCFYKPFPDWSLSTVARDDLCGWLRSRGVRTGFFFPTAVDAADYLDPSHPRYSAKLAATVKAWQSVTDPGGKPPKQALEKWLREHAAEFGLTDSDGNPVKKAMEDCSIVANWQPGGGAPKTPG
jgi:hypothetical protein